MMTRFSGAIFLDRDGVINEEVNYLSSPNQIKLITGAARAISKANDATVPVVVITNQSGVARGFFPESRLCEIHSQLDILLVEYAAHIDRYYYCPHHPDATVSIYRKICSCRKPEPGMLLQAASELDLDLTQSLMIGDRLSDIQAGKKVGCKTSLVLTGYGKTSIVEAMESGTTDIKDLNIQPSIDEAISFYLNNL
jgi:D-glycero-D-manno-heptose 1,7-bisphosphate phosphatase